MKKPEIDPDEATRAADSSERRKFVARDEALRTALIPGRGPTVTQRGMPAAVTQRDMPLVREPAITARDIPVAQQTMVTATELVAGREPAITAQVTAQMPATREPPPEAPESFSDGPTGEHQRAKVWVATHKPPEDPDPRLILLCDPDSPRAASFRVLRHRLQERDDPRVIAVTSAHPREGKTTCAANLAMALGECGRAHVLLVEANLRAPALAALFGFLPPECFTVQLGRHRESPLDPWSVVEVFSPALHVAAVKPGPENENRPLLDGVAFAAAIDALKRAGYDYVVIDTPPVLGDADVNLIQDAADGVLLTARSRQSSGRALRDAIEQLAPSKLLGVTLLDA
jgi:Mrp family chromosome partitioning ATPase